MNEESRLTFLAANYDNLRSLRLAPFYAIFIVAPWLNFPRISITVGVAWIGLCFAWFFLLGAQYTRRYGRVEPIPASGRKPGLWKNPANLLLLLYPITSVCSIDVILNQRPSGGAFLLAGMILGSGMRPSNIWLRRSYYIAANTSTILLAMAVMIRRMPGHLFFSAYAETFLGVMLLVLGILDHLVLSCTFRQGPGHVYA